MTPLTADRVAEKIRSAEPPMDPEDVIREFAGEYGTSMTRDMVLEMLEKGVVFLDWNGKLKFRLTRRR